jgi:ABC-type uncharacterized transport system permease subunit
MAKKKSFPITQTERICPATAKWFYKTEFSLVEIKGNRCMDMIFTKPIDNYFRLFFVTIDAWDWSRWLFSWILEVYEKDRVKEKRMNELGITVLI